MLDFECHITMRGERNEVEEAVRRVGFGWTFSCIDSDPVLGDEVFCYATNHYPTESIAITETSCAKRDLLGLGMNVVRAKVELIVFDERYGVNNA